MASAQHSGHIESLLAAKFPKVRFRNFGWEGDTVFAQPRDYNFPPLVDHLRKAKVGIAFVQFGRAEALSEQVDFSSAYKRLLTELTNVVGALVLVTPIPFENAGAPLPDVSKRNNALKEISNAILATAKEMNLPVVDLFSRLQKKTARLTDDGLQITPFGHALVARTFAELLGFPTAAQASEDGRWEDENLEMLRQAIVAKNSLWFHYWRPQNWAFLGGDRIEQPSSRDHRDPKVRWFPAEIEKFREFIQEQEAEIETLTKKVNEE